MTWAKTWQFLIIGVTAWLGVEVGVALAEEVLPKPPAPFGGKIDMSRDKSTPDWPQTVKAPAGAPNIVLVLLDDVGFGAASAFGGPVETPDSNGMVRARVRRRGRVANRKDIAIIDEGIASANRP